MSGRPLRVSLERLLLVCLSRCQKERIAVRDARPQRTFVDVKRIAIAARNSAAGSGTITVTGAAEPGRKWLPNCRCQMRKSAPSARLSPLASPWPCVAVANPKPARQAARSAESTSPSTLKSADNGATTDSEPSVYKRDASQKRPGVAAAMPQ